MTALTNADLARLVTCVTIHDGRNPYGLHLGTFERLAEHGLVAATDVEYSGVEYDVTPAGAYVVAGMLDRAMAMIAAAKSSPNPAHPEKTT